MRPAVSSGGGQSPDHSISSLSSTSVSSFMDHSARGGGGGMEGDGEEDSWTDVETRVSGVQVGLFRLLCTLTLCKFFLYDVFVQLVCGAFNSKLY